MVSLYFLDVVPRAFMESCKAKIGFDAISNYSEGAIFYFLNGVLGLYICYTHIRFPNVSVQ